jgi:isoleucyl-tRNA synthetase
MAYNFSQEEEKILKFWQEQGIFEKSLEKTKKGKPFVFYDGPPFATGTPHYGHLLQSVIKDAIPRYKTMRGFYVERQWGWDCHGLPIENIVEKEIGTKSKKDILALGVKKFNDLCREKIFTFIGEWERIIPRFGRWADMKHPYRTMDFEYMQSEWWAFKELHSKGLIYEDYRSMHICPRCETTLSQGEVADGYKDIKDLSVTVKFKLVDEPKTFFLAWTTTPWTLPGNVALAIGADIEYVKVTSGEEKFILAKNRVDEVFKDKTFEIVESIKAKDLVGLKYEPLFDYYASDKNLKNRENGWKVYAADFVTADEGTGIAHEAPAFGADDWALLKKYHLPFVQHVKIDGTLKPEVIDFLGLDLKPRDKDKPEEVRKADIEVLRALGNKVFDKKTILHSYPHCWRCDTALLNYATSSWFVAVEKIKPKLLETAKKIHWSPEHTKEGRFGQWLLGARDWSISRQRFWANTIPVWRCETCKKEMVFSSAEELEKASGVLVGDLHKDVVDEVIFTCKCGGEFRRVPDVLDTWFDSGSVAFATKRPIPADFIGEAQDQTRAWFYYQHVLIGALFGKMAFKNAIATGFIWAEDGKKMSKKLKNYPDPMEVMEKYGADAMRFYILSSPVVMGENLSFSEKGVDEIARKNIGRLYNVLEFYKLYADNTSAADTSKHILDTWILAKLGELISVSTEGYENYRLDSATRPLTDFIDDLSAWYVRRSRERFKDNTDDKQSALATLRYVLEQLSRVMAPAMPFFAEYLFQAVRASDEEESVHLAQWPEDIKKTAADAKILDRMTEARRIVGMALAARVAKGLKVKQPLASLTVNSKTSNMAKDQELLDIIKDEVNVKEVRFDDSIKSEVALDTVLTEALKEEGLLREVVRLVQDMRKEQGLKPEDSISILTGGDDAVMSVLRKNEKFFLREVRAKEVTIADSLTDSAKQSTVNGYTIFLTIKKIS